MRTKDYWKSANFYDRFEFLATSSLVLAIAVIVVISLFRLFHTLILRLADWQTLLEAATIQTLLGMMMVVLIVLEFGRSVVHSMTNFDAIVQIKAIVFIAIMAVVRKLIIVDVEHTNETIIFAIAALLVSLGILYWLTDVHARKLPDDEPEKMEKK